MDVTKQEKAPTTQFLSAQDIMAIMGISQSQAYLVIRNLNEKLKQDGYLTVRGKVSRRYFEENVYV